MNHSHKLLWIFLGIVVLLIGSIAIYGFYNITPISIHLENPRATTTDSTADWKTYRNEKYGFEFKYPGEWTPEVVDRKYPSLTLFKDRKNNEMIRLWTPILETSYPDIIIQTDQIKVSGSEKTIQKRLTKDGENNPPTYFIDRATWGDNSGELIMQMSNLQDEKLKLFDKILSTFKFTDTVDTSNWKTYRNEKYGFEFRYPTNIFPLVVDNQGGVDFTGVRGSLIVSFTQEKFDQNKEYGNYEKLGQEIFGTQNRFGFKYGWGNSTCGANVTASDLGTSTLWITFKSCIGDKSPIQMDSAMQKQILSTFKFTQ